MAPSESDQGEGAERTTIETELGSPTGSPDVLSLLRPEGGEVADYVGNTKSKTSRTMAMTLTTIRSPNTA